MSLDLINFLQLMQLNNKTINLLGGGLEPWPICRMECETRSQAHANVAMVHRISKQTHAYATHAHGVSHAIYVRIGRYGCQT